MAKKKAESSPEFRGGDQVQLKSGGPVMTCTGKLVGESLECQWFVSNKLQHGWFNRAVLIHYETPPPPDEIRDLLDGAKPR